MIGELLALAGAVLVLLAALGVLRFDDSLARLHALAKASTLGILLILAGAAINLHTVNDITSVVLAALLHVLVSPPASNMVSRATYLVSGVPPGEGTIDEGVEPLGLRRPDDHGIDP
ncbi:MAG TPA: monovalent cation/H(+) antiporter subunit G [Acidimicrobiales bacterium]|nr:monovalent cation/H(+) antiporter subunit G [Acidimicrobiales bacterium]